MYAVGRVMYGGMANREKNLGKLWNRFHETMDYSFYSNHGIDFRDAPLALG